jgi:hypothetical protein
MGFYSYARDEVGLAAPANLTLHGFVGSGPIFGPDERPLNSLERSSSRADHGPNV